MLLNKYFHSSYIKIPQVLHQEKTNPLLETKYRNTKMQVFAAFFFFGGGGGGYEIIQSPF